MRWFFPLWLARTSRRSARSLKHKLLYDRCRIRQVKLVKGSQSGLPLQRNHKEQRETAQQILGALGEEVFVEDESYLDMATALSGSGPHISFSSPKP